MTFFGTRVGEPQRLRLWKQFILLGNSINTPEISINRTTHIQNMSIQAIHISNSKFQNRTKQLEFGIWYTFISYKVTMVSEKGMTRLVCLIVMMKTPKTPFQEKTNPSLPFEVKMRRLSCPYEITMVIGKWNDPKIAVALCSLKRGYWEYPIKNLKRIAGTEYGKRKVLYHLELNFGNWCGQNFVNLKENAWISTHWTPVPYTIILQHVAGTIWTTETLGYFTMNNCFGQVEKK